MEIIKRCRGCQETDLNQFNKNKTKTDGLQSFCKSCSRNKSKEYYNNNKEKHLIYTRKAKKDRIVEAKQYILSLLAINPCTICKESDPVVLEFDHLSNKKKTIAEMVGEGYRLQSIKDEISKCQVLCANCHRRKTATDFGWYKLGL